MEKLHSINRSIIILLILGLLCFSAKGQERQDATMKNSITIVAKQFEMWKNGTANFFDLLADDATWVVSGKSPVSGSYIGKKDFMERAVKPIVDKLKEPLKPELISLTADGKFIWLHFKAKAITKTNEIYENTYIWKLQLNGDKISSGIAFLDTYELVQLVEKNKTTMEKTIEQTKGYIGMWVTEDGHIRQELLPNNRYDEARGNRQSAYQGSYKVTGNEIYYKDDTGFTADGKFVDENTLHHGGYIFYKQLKK